MCGQAVTYRFEDINSEGGRVKPLSDVIEEIHGEYE
jgi:hypothetical protein